MIGRPPRPTLFPYTTLSRSEGGAGVAQPVEPFLNGAILDIYVTANRPDCMSMMGIAREVHALFGAPYTPAMLRLLDPATARVEGSPGAPAIDELLSVRIDDAEGCPRFTASVVRGIHIGPSPRWMERRRDFAGCAPRHNRGECHDHLVARV